MKFFKIYVILYSDKNYVNYIKLSVEISKRGEKFNMNNDFIELNDIDTLEVAKPLKDKMNLL